jgi:hypothetical protein
MGGIGVRKFLPRRKRVMYKTHHKEMSAKTGRTTGAVLAIVAGVAGAVTVAISLAEASRSWAGKIGVVGVGAEVIAVSGVVSVKSQGLGSGGCAVTVAVLAESNDVSTTERGKRSCWSKFGVVGVGLVIDKLDSIKCWRSQKENL